MYLRIKKKKNIQCLSVGIMILVNMFSILFFRMENTEHIPQEKIPQHKETLSNLQQTVKPLQELHKYKDSHYESQVHETNYSTFSTSKIVSLYTNYTLGRNKSEEKMSFLQSKIGTHGSLSITSMASYKIVPNWSKSIDDDNSQGKVLYLILSHEKGTEGSKRREIVRRLWTRELGNKDRHAFVVPMFETDEENADLLGENENFKDILQTGHSPSDSHFHSKQDISSLYFSNHCCDSFHHTILLLDSVIINAQAMNMFLATQTYTANRIYGIQRF